MGLDIGAVLKDASMVAGALLGFALLGLALRRIS
jgi:hypothetical protein